MMIRKYIYTLATMMMMAGFTANAQTVADFENITLPSSGFANGSDGKGQFTSGNVLLRNNYDTAWGGSWFGFAISNKGDMNTPGYLNQYSCIAGKGYNNSSNFALGYSYSTLVLTNQAAGKEAKGFWINNNTYAYLSMKNGDSIFAKKFGGVSGNDTDWLKLTIQGYKGGSPNKSKEFYLADYQNKDNSKDYIIKDWTWVDLTSLGNVDSLTFSMYSTDTGKYGMNTPGYFCMDNFTTTDYYTGIQESNTKNIFVYPCPANEVLYVSESMVGKKVSLHNLQGDKVSFTSSSSHSIDISALSTGIYLLQIIDGNELLQTKFVKQ